MKSIVYAPFVFMFFIVVPVWAQQQPPSDPIGENLFPPELLMQHQQELGLSEDQKTFAKAEILKAQSHFTELQWELQTEMETMVVLLKENRVDEQKVLTRLDKILNLEREIKRTHFSLIIRIKNKLTSEQQAQLREIKNKTLK